MGHIKNADGWPGVQEPSEHFPYQAMATTDAMPSIRRNQLWELGPVQGQSGRFWVLRASIKQRNNCRGKLEGRGLLEIPRSKKHVESDEKCGLT